MKLIYQNFDKLDISFQGAVPKRILKVLEQAKQEAKQARCQFPAAIGPRKLPVMVYETGAKGGYTYMFNTGLDGEIWTISDREDVNQWNIRVSVSSLGLALHGYEGMKKRVLDILIHDLQACGPTGRHGIPMERVSRLDYCLDFLFDDPFAPNVQNFVCASRTKKGTILTLPAQIEEVGQYVEYIRVGKMPNRQIVIYNKTRELSAHHKHYWWKLWGLDKEKTAGQIWRVEIRAGKKELNHWNLKKFDDLEECVGDVISQTLKDFEYRDRNENDQNMTRWERSKLWDAAITACEKNLIQYTCKTERKEILKGIRKEYKIRFEKLIKGVFIGYTALTGKDISEIPGVMERVIDQVASEINSHPDESRKKHKIKLERYAELI